MSQVKKNNARLILLLVIFTIGILYINFLVGVDKDRTQELKRINPIKHGYNSTIDSIANDFKWIYVKLSSNKEFMIKVKSFKLDSDDFEKGDRIIKIPKSNQFTLIKLSGDTIRFEVYDDYY